MATFLMWIGSLATGWVISWILYGSWSRKAATTQLLQHLKLISDSPALRSRFDLRKFSMVFCGVDMQKKNWNPSESQWSLFGTVNPLFSETSRIWRSDSPVPNLEETEVIFVFGNPREFSLGFCPTAGLIPPQEVTVVSVAKLSARQQVSLKSVRQGCKHATPLGTAGSARTASLHICQDWNGHMKYRNEWKPFQWWNSGSLKIWVWNGMKWWDRISSPSILGSKISRMGTEPVN